MKRNILLTFLIGISLGSYAQDLRITEIMYNPSNSDSAWEWVEIYNAGTEIVDLTGYVFDDNSGAAYSESNIPSGTILSGKSAILFNASALSENDFRQVWGSVDLIPVTRWSSLNNGGDSIGIWTSFEAYVGDNASQENVIEQVAYAADGEIWPEDDGAASIFLTDLDADNNLGTNWSLSTVGAVTPLFKAYGSIVFETNDGLDIGSPGLPGSVDIEKPIIICPADVNMVSDEDNCGANFPIELPTATDNESTQLQLAGIRNDGLELDGTFSVGETTIIWTATDEAGNVSDSCTQTIRITDEVPPILNCPESIVVSSEDGNPVEIEIEFATASSVCEGELNLSFTRSDDLGLQEPYPVGITTIKWKALDASNNMSECEQLITVNASASMENEIISFSISEQLGESEIDSENKTVKLRVPFGTDITALIPTIEISQDATISPNNGEARNFTEPVLYIVTSEDETEQVWTVVVEVEEEEEEVNPLAITAFVLVNAETNEDILELTQGMLIDVKDLPTLNLDIRADATEDVGSVQLFLDGSQNYSRTENVAPFALFGDSPTGNYNGNDFIAGTYLLMATSYSQDNGEGEMSEVFSVSFELIEETQITVTDFMLVNAETNEDLFLIKDGMEIDVNSLPTTNLDIRAITGEGVESVQLQLEGSMELMRVENVAPYALYGDFPVGDYNGMEFTEGQYIIGAIPFSEDALGGDRGTSLSISFELVDLAPIVAITNFTLVNADTNEDIMDLNEGIQIEITELPTQNLAIRANVSSAVKSVSLSLSGAKNSSRTENVAPYALFGDFPTGKYNGSNFLEGTYVITAIGYSETNLGGEASEPLSLQFELVNNLVVAESVNSLKVYPNPVSHKAVLHFESPKDLTVIRLYDLLGRVVATYQGKQVTRGDNYVLDIESIPEGNYYIKSQDRFGHSYLKQIVIKK